MMVAAELRQTEARDGPAGDAVALNNSKYIELPKNVTKHISGDRPRTICLWARIDKWTNDARIFEYGRKAPQGELFGLRTWDTPGSFAILEQHPKGAYTNVTVNLTDTDRLVAQGPSPGPTMGSVYDGSYSYSYADSSSAESPSYGGSYSYSYVYSYSYANSRRDRRLTFDSDSGSPPWHRLWEKTWHHYCVTYAAVPKEKDRPRNVTFYVDGVAEDTWKATVNTSLGSPLYIGADVQGSKTLDGAVDEVYVYEDALDAWQVGVLYGIISPPPSAVPTSPPTALPTPLPSSAPSAAPAALQKIARFFRSSAPPYVRVTRRSAHTRSSTSNRWPDCTKATAEGRTRSPATSAASKVARIVACLARRAAALAVAVALGWVDDVAAGDDDGLLAQDLEVARDGRLGDLEEVGEVEPRQRLGLEVGLDDAQPRLEAADLAAGGAGRHRSHKSDVQHAIGGRAANRTRNGDSTGATHQFCSQLA